MSRKTRLIVTAVLVLAAAVLIWAGGGAFYRLLLALHGKH
jgi:hypothetical protein